MPLAPSGAGGHSGPDSFLGEASGVRDMGRMQDSTGLGTNLVGKPPCPSEEGGLASIPLRRRGVGVGSSVTKSGKYARIPSGSYTHP